MAGAEEGLDARAGAVQAGTGSFACAAEDTAVYSVGVVVVDVGALAGEEIRPHRCVF